MYKSFYSVKAEFAFITREKYCQPVFVLFLPRETGRKSEKWQLFLALSVKWGMQDKLPF
jgi:hypothetical protein